MLTPPLVQEPIAALEHARLGCVIQSANLPLVGSTKPTRPNTKPFRPFRSDQLQHCLGCELKLVSDLPFASHFSCFASVLARGLYLRSLLWFHVARHRGWADPEGFASRRLCITEALPLELITQSDGLQLQPDWMHDTTRCSSFVFLLFVAMEIFPFPCLLIQLPCAMPLADLTLQLANAQHDSVDYVEGDRPSLRIDRHCSCELLGFVCCEMRELFVVTESLRGPELFVAPRAWERGHPSAILVQCQAISLRTSRHLLSSLSPSRHRSQASAVRALALADLLARPWRDCGIASSSPAIWLSVRAYLTRMWAASPLRQHAQHQQASSTPSEHCLATGDRPFAAP